eukprot:GHVH01007026.1.p1 GENE.GHVH01007026.1~~GHVH01007026.1.p1  ORF type:complete len:258 (+),score=42.59 GHVH01007026.1:40-774(+)
MSTFSASQSTEIGLSVALGLNRDEYEAASRSKQWQAMYSILKLSMPGQMRRNFDFLTLLAVHYEGNQDPEDGDIPEERWIEAVVQAVLIDQGFVVFHEGCPIYISSANLISRFKELTLDLQVVEFFLPTFITSFNGTALRFSIEPLTQSVTGAVEVDWEEMKGIHEGLANGYSIDERAVLQKHLEQFIEKWNLARPCAAMKNEMVLAGDVTASMSAAVVAFTISFGVYSNDMGPRSLGYRANMT